MQPLLVFAEVKLVVFNAVVNFTLLLWVYLCIAITARGCFR